MHHTEKEDCSKKSENLERKNRKQWEKPTSSHMNKPKIFIQNWKKPCLYIFKKKPERENENSGGTTILDNKCNFCFLKDPMIVI